MAKLAAGANLMGQIRSISWNDVIIMILIVALRLGNIGHISCRNICEL